MLIPFWDGGQDAALDVTVVHPIQAAFVAEASNTAGHALESVDKASMAVDCGIILGADTRQLLAKHQVKQLAACLARQKGQEEQEAARHAFSRLATLIQKGNANIISNSTLT